MKLNLSCVFFQDSEVLYFYSICFLSQKTSWACSSDGCGADGMVDVFVFWNKSYLPTNFCIEFTTLVVHPVWSMPLAKCSAGCWNSRKYGLDPWIFENIDPDSRFLVYGTLKNPSFLIIPFSLYTFPLLVRLRNMAFQQSSSHRICSRIRFVC